MTTLEILIAARKKIEREENWTQGAFRRVDNGNERFCASGAVRALGDVHLGSGAYFALLNSVRPEYDQVCRFNDTHTHAEVLELFDKAIAKEQANG